MADLISRDGARALRRLWFDYLDTVAPFRPKLHAFCLRLTGSVWDAEDLVQDTLLRGFGAIGRADMSPGRDAEGHGGRWFDKPEGYLCQVATNLWIDRRRRAARELLQADVEVGAGAAPAILTRAAGAALFDRTSPQERAAVVLKDVFDFSLDEIAALLATSEGAVKSALHRGRDKLAPENAAMPSRHKPASVELIDRFIAAFNTHDANAVIPLLLESVTYEPQGVGGERGANGIWLRVSFFDSVTVERFLVFGEHIAAHTFLANGKKRLGTAYRLEESEGKISRVINYFFCPETLALISNELGFARWSNGYHQTGETLDRMIANADLPWASEQTSASGTI
jgi:RNA polymerase sigma-70 factor (ECF subfamily)